MLDDKTGLRLDKWLWYARLFKTRALASKAITSCRFRLDGDVMSKPHRKAKCGQVLTFSKGAGIKVIRIKGMASRRGPASEAALLYDDLSPDQSPSEKKELSSVSAFENRQAGDGRPTKRQRRETDRLKTGFSDIGG